MKKSTLLFAVLLSSIIHLQLAAGERGTSIERIIRFEHRVVNEAAKPGDIEFFLSIPQNNERQDILFFYPEPGCREVITDEYGHRILHYVDKAVPPGEVVCHGWIAEVRLFSYVYDGKPLSSAAGTLTEAQKSLYLQDAENYQITSPIIKNLAQSITASAENANQTVKRFFEHLIYEVTYARDLVWDPAPVVLERKSGSCSEYNYAFLALCRAAKIPCRYSGGIIVRTDKIAKYDYNVAEDAVFHRWSEVFLEETGWFPIDCSRGSSEIKRYGNPYNQFGRLPAGVLQTVRGDGAGNSSLGWDYLSKDKVEFESSNKELKVGFCLKDIPPGQLKEQIKVVESKIAGPQNQALFEELVASSLNRELLFLFRNQIKKAKIPALIHALQKVHHPDALYWTVLAQKRGLEIPYHATYPFLCEGSLTQTIAKYLKGDQFDLVDFEYWWRKARPMIVFDSETELFTLPFKNLNLF